MTFKSGSYHIANSSSASFNSLKLNTKSDIIVRGNIDNDIPAFGGPLLSQTSPNIGTVAMYGVENNGDIRRIPFALETVSSDVGEVIEGGYSAGAHSESEAFLAGRTGPPPSTQFDLEKFSFSSQTTTATSVGEIASSPEASPANPVNMRLDSQQGHASASHGFWTGGKGQPTPSRSDPSSPTPTVLQIAKFPFSIATVSGLTEVGTLNEPHAVGFGHSSLTDGFVVAGQGWQNPLPAPFVAPTHRNIESIEKFPFSITSGSSSDVGELAGGARQANPYGAGGHASDTTAFQAGGDNLPTSPYPQAVDTINKFPFSISSGSTADHGELSFANNSLRVAHHSVSSKGYIIKAGPTPLGMTSKGDVYTFNFTSPATSADLGQLTGPTSSTGNNFDGGISD